MSAAEILAQPLCALAFCWRLERRDGVTIGLTSHDRSLSIGGLTYAAAPGIVPSAIATRNALEAGTMDVQGAISSAAISDDDLDAGRWDGAAVALHLTEWTDPGALWLELARGELGAVERDGGQFSAELRGPLAMLEGPVAPETSPDCRAHLGDRDCRVSLVRHRRVVRVEDVDAAEVVLAGVALVSGDFAFGSIRWLTGRNAGIIQAIVASDTDRVILVDPPPFAVLTGTLAELTQGCDRQLSTCAARFGNVLNFRGEPYLPGNDLLTRYPGS